MGSGGGIRAAPSAFLLLLFLAPAHPSCQALLLPPLSVEEPSGRQGLLPDVRPWAGFRHFPAGAGDSFHNHVLDFGSDIALFAAGPFSVQGTVRQILLTRPHPDGEWLFWLASLYTDLRLGGRWDAGPWAFGLAYRHDCKHDIETYYGRDAAHDGIALSAAFRFAWTWPGTGLESRGAASAEAVWNVPVLYQFNPAEPDRFTLSGQVDWEPVRAAGWPAPFLSAGAALIGRGTDTRVKVMETASLDWNARAGLRMAGAAARSGTLSLYGQLESLSDDWMGLEPSGSVLFSLAVLLGF